METDATVTTVTTVAEGGHARRGEVLLDKIEWSLALASLAVSLVKFGYGAGYDDATSDLKNANGNSPT